MMRSKEVRWVVLGDYIQPCDERNNSRQQYSVLGINRDKTFMPTVANIAAVDLSKYKVVRNGSFVFSGMQTGRDICIRIALYKDEKPAIISPAYTTFTAKENEILPEYLFMYFNRGEMDRYGWFISDSSVRSNLDWVRFIEIKIPIPFSADKPDLDKQRELVEAWRGLREMKEENERIAEPLESLCRSYLQDLKYKYPLCAIGPYIEPCDARNSDLTIKLSQGIANSKVFQAPKQVAENSRSDKIVRKGQFAYNRATTRNGEKISIAYREGEDCTVSSAYQVFYINDEDKLNPYFLWLWFKRSEFDRYARYMSKGSAHEFFEFDEMCRVEIPLPPIEVQRAIVDIYRCADECRKIAAEANSLSTTICPALIQKIING